MMGDREEGARVREGARQSEIGESGTDRKRKEREERKDAYKAD